ncbi:vomeronasal type-2 receptor 1-like [Lissotriton helveticus]
MLSSPPPLRLSLMLVLLWMPVPSNGKSCSLRSSEQAGYREAGDVLIGGTFPVTYDRMDFIFPYTEEPKYPECHVFHIYSYFMAQAMAFAVAEINHNKTLLPNITLGFVIYNTCVSLRRIHHGTMWMLTGKEVPILNYRCQSNPPMVAIIGDSSSTRSIPMARLLGLSRHPQVSYFATSPLLSDKVQFPSFLRTIPSDIHLILGLAELVVHFGWTWVGLLTNDNDYGEFGGNVLKEELLIAGVCIAFHEIIPVVITASKTKSIIEVLKKSSARVVIAYTTATYMIPVMDELSRENVSGIVWIATESWAASPTIANKGYGAVMNGTIGLAIHEEEMPGFKDFLHHLHPSTSPNDILLKPFWEAAFGCQWPRLENTITPQSQEMKRLCSGMEKLETNENPDIAHPDFRLTYNIYNAVYIVAKALQDMHACIPGKGPLYNNTCASLWNFSPWQSLESPPGRPIVSGIGSILEPLSKFSDAFLRPLVQGTNTYLKDTKSVLQLLQNLDFDPNSQLLLSLDVESLYMSLPHDETINIIEEVLYSANWKYQTPRGVVMECITMALTKNFFEFEGTLYLRSHGTSMGSTFAPNLAGLYVHHLESTKILHTNNPYKQHIVIWRRYSDDVFVIWQGDHQTVSEFMQWLNQQNRFLKFTHTVSNKELVFLDLNIFSKDGKLHTTTHFKPTSRTCLLRYDSFHPRNLRTNLPYGQFLRLRRNCTQIKDYKTQAQDLKKKLQQRRYPEKIIDVAMKRARNNNREALLENKIPPDEASTRPICVTTYSSSTNEVSKLMNKHWRILNSGTLNIEKPMFAHRRGKKLKDMLLLHYLKRVHLKSQVDGAMYFDQHGDPPTVYDIVNWHLQPDGNPHVVTVGSFNRRAPKGQRLIFYGTALHWNTQETQVPVSVCSNSCSAGYRKALQKGRPVCCFDCVPCAEGEISNETDSTTCWLCPIEQWSNDKRTACIPKKIEFLSYQEPLGITLAVVVTLTAFSTCAILCIFIKFRETPIVKANNRELTYLLLGALVLSFLFSLLFIGEPQPIACLLRQVAFGIIFAVCVSCVLAKTLMVVIAFNVTKPGSNLRRWLGPRVPVITVSHCTLGQILICVIWILRCPPFAEKNMKLKIGTIVFRCNECSETALWCMLGYIGLLACASFLVAFLARKLPDSFNEAKWITFSMLVFLSVWLSFVPGYLSTQGKYTVAVEVFAITSSSAGLLVCIFLPKCYIILLRPDLNTKENLLGKGKNTTNKMKTF